MYICLCKAITDSQIRDAIEGGANSMKAIRQELGAMTQCGKCACDTHAILQDTVANKSHASPLWSAA